MATPTPKRDPFARYPPRPDNIQHEVVNPRWLAKALAIALGAAAVLGYLAVCLLVHLGGWQLFLHPSRLVDKTPQSVGIAFDPIRFDAAATGQPRVAGWWIPAVQPGVASPTILLLHGGDGSLSSTLPELARLHGTPVNVFAIDYRGFGQSEGPHPSEARMTEDAAAALDYLINTRHIAPATIVPYGVGLGAALAAALMKAHPELPAVILDNPDPDAGSRPLRESRSRLIPMKLLLQDHFDLRGPLAALHRPKLLITGGDASKSAEQMAVTQRLFESAPDPKMSVSLPAGDHNAAFDAYLTRFLDEYLPPADPAAQRSR